MDRLLNANEFGTDDIVAQPGNRLLQKFVGDDVEIRGPLDDV